MDKLQTGSIGLRNMGAWTFVAHGIVFVPLLSRCSRHSWLVPYVQWHAESSFTSAAFTLTATCLFQDHIQWSVITEFWKTPNPVVILNSYYFYYVIIVCEVVFKSSCSLLFSSEKFKDYYSHFRAKETSKLSEVIQLLNEEVRIWTQSYLTNSSHMRNGKIYLVYSTCARGRHN